MDAESSREAAMLARPAKDSLGFADQHQQDLSGAVLLPVIRRRF